MRFSAVLPSFRRCAALALCAVTAAASALAQQNWRWANSLPASVQWKDIAFGNGLYVAVGGDATIATSPDGGTWTIRRMSTANLVLNAVAFANGRFVAAGLGSPTITGAGLIMTSTDGLEWTINETIASTVNAQFNEVLFGGGTWVVSGAAGGRAFTSTDGLNWTARSLPAGVIPGTGTYGAGRFVLSGNGNTVLTSTDGATWTRLPVAGAIGASSPFISDVAFAAGKFAAVGRDSSFNSVAYTSTDATTWTQSAAIPVGSGGVGLIAVSSNGTSFVAGGSATEVYSSTDGNTWTRRTSALPNSVRQLGAIAEPFSATVSANNLFFILGSYGSITTSTDGTVWTRRSTGTVNELGGLVHDGNRFVATGSGGTVLTSPDGTAWTQLTTGATADFNRLAYSGTRYVAVGFNGIHHSTNLTTWTAVSGTTFDRWADVVYGNGRFVAATTSTTLGVRTSTDGVTWSAATPIAGAGGNTSRLIFGNGQFVLLMAGFGTTPSRIFSSTDGTGWTNRTPADFPAGVALESIAFGGGRFVIITGNRNTLTSTDGLTWTLNPLPPTLSLGRINYLGSQFAARSATYGAQTYVSTDGVTWTALANSLAPNAIANSMLAVGDTVVAVGAQGIILRADRAAAPVAPPPSAAGRLVNMSIRTTAGTDDATLIVGVGLGGANTSGNKAVLLRAVGPTLSAFGVGGALADTIMTVFQGTAQVAQNDDWDAAAGATFAGLGAFAFGAGSRDSAIYNNAIPSGSYSIQIAGKGGATGIALAEIYDATPSTSFAATTPRLVNVSARTRVGTGDNILIAGFVIGGESPVRVLIRAVGPTLSAFGVGDTLADPKLDVFSGSAVVASNDNWDAATAANFSRVGAFAFTAGSRDAALVATLQPGSYTAQVSGVNNTSGVALVELYELP